MALSAHPTLARYALFYPWFISCAAANRGRAGLCGPYTHPNASHPGHSARARRAGPSPNRLWQNRRLCLAPVATVADPPTTRPQPARGRRPVRALVLVPTRELAAQVGEVLRRLAPPATALKIAVVFGGVSINPQMMALRGGADVVVATPGRLLDLLQHNALRLTDVQHLVLDEADRLLDLGFADELQQVLQQLPARRQSLFFSATYPPAVQALASALLRDPVRLQIDDTAPAEALQIEQRAIGVDTAQRTPLLRHWLRTEGWKQVLVFVASQYSAEHVANKLYNSGIYATAFHGGLSQGARQQVLDEFKAGRWDVLITTDLASRGIDIAQLPVVINYDLPRSAVDYVHRIGRTGRAGASGLAISLVSPDTQAHWRLIEKRQGLNVSLEEVPGFAIQTSASHPQMPAASAETANHNNQNAINLPANHPNAPGNGGIKGKRPSKKDKLRAAAAAKNHDDGLEKKRS